MRPRPFLILALLALPAAAFEGYAALLEDSSYGLLPATILAARCEGFARAPFPLVAEALARPELEAVRAEVLAARERYLLAERAARAQELLGLVLGGTSLEFGGSRLATHGCFSHGLASLAHAVRANRHALLALGARAAEFEHAAGDAPHPLALGFSRELRDSRRALEERRAGDDSFGARWLRRVRPLAAAREALAANRPDAAAAVAGAVRDLLEPRNSSLAQALAFEASARQALDALEQGWSRVRRDLDETERGARRVLADFEREELEQVDESAFLLVGAGSVLAAEHNLTSFSQLARIAREQLDEAGALRQEAERDRRERGRGFASRSLSRAEEALVLAGTAADRLAGAARESLALERDLRERARLEASRLRTDLQARLARDPYASANAQRVLGEFETAAQGRQLATRGARVRYFAETLTRLRDASQWLREASAWAADLQARLEARAEELAELLERAGRDGLPAAQGLRRLARAREALNQLARLPEGPRGAGLEGVREDLAALEREVLAEAGVTFAPVLEGLWSRIGAVRELLPAGEQASLVAHESLFSPDGRLRVRDSLGSLQRARESLERAWANAEARMPALLRRHLEAGARVEWRLPIAGLDERVDGRILIEVRNDLPVSYAGLLELEPDGLQGVDAEPVSGTRNLTLRGGALRLAGVRSGEGIRAELSWRGVLAETRSVLRAQEGEATAQAARFRTVLRFAAVRAGGVRVVHAVPYPALLTAAGLRLRGQHAFSSPGGSRLEALIDAAKGENELVLEEEVQEPFSARAGLDAGPSNRSVVLRLRLEGGPVDLQRVTHAQREPLPCPDAAPEAARAPAGASAEAVPVGESVLITVRAPRLARGSTLDFLFPFRCSGLGEAARERLAMVEALLERAPPESADARRLLDEARGLLDAGDFSRALASADRAARLVEDSIATAFRDAAARARLEMESSGLSEELGAAEGAAWGAGVSSLLARARESFDRFRQVLASGDVAQAAESLGRARADLANAARVLDASLDQRILACASERCEPVRQAYREAQAHLASRAWVLAAGAAGRAERLEEDARKADEEGAAGVRALLEEVPSLRERFESARREFEEAFEVPPELEKARRSSPEYARGLRAQRSGTAELKPLARAWEAWQAEGDASLAAESAPLLRERTERVEAAALELRESVERVREEAARALAESELAEAKRALAEGRPFTAWALAREEMAKPPGEGGGPLAWTLGLAAAAILIVLAWVFSRGPNAKGLREVD